jgi:ribosomal protein S18 acetylase RimI-like enzyme
MALAIRRGTVADAPALATFAERIFRQTFGPDNRPEDMDAYVTPAYNDAQQAEELGDPGLDTLLGEVHGELVAFAQLRRGTPPPCVGVPSARELWRFYVGQAWHGRGIAPLMMDAALDSARARGAGAVWLAVWDRNPRAIAFYTRCGFSDVGSRPFLLGSDTQVDLLMLRAFDAAERTEGR